MDDQIHQNSIGFLRIGVLLLGAAGALVPFLLAKIYIPIFEQHSVELPGLTVLFIHQKVLLSVVPVAMACAAAFIPDYSDSGSGKLIAFLTMVILILFVSMAILAYWIPYSNLHKSLG